MAYPGKTISNRATGQSILFLRTAKDTQGQFLEMETTLAPHSLKPALHYHPNQDEVFTIISGELTVEINEQIRRLTPGQQISIPRNTSHSMWNASSKTTIVNWKVVPALDTELFFENAIGIMTELKGTKKGMPPFLQSVLLAERFHKEYRLSKPPVLIQKLLFALLKPIGLLVGYRGFYEKHID